MFHPPEMGSHNLSVDHEKISFTNPIPPDIKHHHSMIRYQISHFIPYIHHDVEVVFDMNGGNLSQ